MKITAKDPNYAFAVELGDEWTAEEAMRAALGMLTTMLGWKHADILMSMRNFVARELEEYNDATAVPEAEFKHITCGPGYKFGECVPDDPVHSPGSESGEDG